MQSISVEQNKKISCCNCKLFLCEFEGVCAWCMCMWCSASIYAKCCFHPAEVLVWSVVSLPRGLGTLPRPASFETPSQLMKRPANLRNDPASFQHAPRIAPELPYSIFVKGSSITAKWGGVGGGQKVCVTLEAKSANVTLRMGWRGQDLSVTHTWHTHTDTHARTHVGTHTYT